MDDEPRPHQAVRQRSLNRLWIWAVAGLIIPGVTLTVLRFWPREFFPLFYTVHLAALGLIAM